MENKFEVGMYVRTKHNGIKKVLDIGEYLGIKQYLINEDDYIIDNSIIGEPSYNPIDLIEAGDYVNGYLVYGSKNVDKLFININGFVISFDEFDIKSIVTHEQFKSMEYEV